MLTIITTAKPFRGHHKTIQTNTIRSWTLLQPRPEIFLFGNEEGYIEIAKELGIRHVPEVQCNEFGLPLASSMIAIAEAQSVHQIFCLMGADIILMSDFMRSIELVTQMKSPFLMVGRWWNVEVNEPLDFEKPDWENGLRDYVHRRTNWRSWAGTAYAVFPRGFLSGIPLFAIGNYTLDNWLIYYARSLRVPVIDASQVVTVIHQKHERSNNYRGPELQRSIELSGGENHRFNIGDATHVLTKEGLRPALGAYYLWRRFYNLSVFYPFFTPLRWLLEGLMRVTKPIRILIGLEFTGYRRR